MKKTFITATLLTAVSLSAHALPFSNTQADDNEFLYEILVEHSDSLKISYIKDEKSIQCWIERTHKGNEQTSKPVNVTENKFNVKPLSACLSKKQARTWLTQR
jgi:hypothetical protein